MPAETQKSASSIDDYLDLFGLLAGLGIEFVVIGDTDVPNRLGREYRLVSGSAAV